MWDDAEVSERWAMDERKRGVGYDTLSPIYFIFEYFLYQARQKMTHFRQNSL